MLNKHDKERSSGNCAARILFSLAKSRPFMHMKIDGFIALMWHVGQLFVWKMEMFALFIITTSVYCYYSYSLCQKSLTGFPFIVNITS